MIAFRAGSGRLTVLGSAVAAFAIGGCGADGVEGLFGSEGGTGSGAGGSAAASGGITSMAQGGSVSKGGSSSSSGGSKAGGSGGAKSTGSGGAKSSGNGGTKSNGGGTAVGGSGGVAGCTSDGKNYAPGESMPSDDCNDCRCEANGMKSCTMVECGTGGRPAIATCEQVRDAIADERALVQACESDDECGQVLEGTSCGCTRDWVARLDADPTRLEDLLATEIDGERCLETGGTCDCPAADGFACVDGACSWDYTRPTQTCQEYPPGRVCILGTPISSGERVEAGMPVSLTITPATCASSSCTEVEVASCSITGSDGEFTFSADFCLADLSGSGIACTDDCGGGGSAQCSSSGATLVAGENRLIFGDKELVIHVPSVLQPGVGCMDL